MPKTDTGDKKQRKALGRKELWETAETRFPSLLVANLQQMGRGTGKKCANRRARGGCLVIQICNVFYFCNIRAASYFLRLRTKVEGSMPRLAAAARTLPYFS